MFETKACIDPIVSPHKRMRGGQVPCFAALEALLGPRGVTLPEIQIEGVSLKIGPHVRSRGRSASKAVVFGHRGGAWKR